MSILLSQISLNQLRAERGILQTEAKSLNYLRSKLDQDIKANCPHMEYKKEEYDDYHSWYAYWLCKECKHEERPLTDRSYKPVTDKFKSLLAQRTEIDTKLSEITAKINQINRDERTLFDDMKKLCKHPQCITLHDNTKICKYCLSQII